MAKVLGITTRPSTAPFNANTPFSTITYNDDIYVITSTKIYKYDGVNNIYSLVFTFPYAIVSNWSQRIGNKIYSSSQNGTKYYHYITRYNLDTGEYEGTFYRWWGQGYRFTIYETSSWLNETENIAYFAYRGYNSGGVSASTYIFSINQEGEYNVPNVDYKPKNQQITDGYFFSRWTGGNDGYWNTQYGRVYTNNTPETILGSNSYCQGNNGSFKVDDKIYLVYPNSNIITYNTLTTEFEQTDHILDFNGKRYVLCDYANNTFYIQGTEYMYTLKFVEYNLEYKIVNNNGNVVYAELKGQSPINSITFNYDTNNVGYVINTLTEIVSGNFDIEIPNNYILTGFTASNDYIRYEIPINKNVDINIDKDTKFYAIFTPFRPPETKFELDVYKNTSEPHRVDKTNFLEKIGTLLGVFRDTVNVVNPIIRIEGDLPNYNYMYIGKLNRYYFVTDYDIVRTGLIDLYLTEDVLMTYREGIYKLKAFVERNEYENNPLLVDKKRIIEEGVNVEVHSIENALMSETLFQPETDIRFVLNGYKIDSADEIPV